MAPAWISYVWGGLAGVGVLCAYYGVKRVTDAKGDRNRRRTGLWLVNFGVICLAASMAGTIWIK